MEDLAAQVLRAQQGDRETRERILRQWCPLALRVASQVAGRFIELGIDDESGVALSAIDEAISRYDTTRGAAWPTFAGHVIRRRLIDHYRKTSRRRPEVPLSSLQSEDEEGNTCCPTLDRLAVERYQEAAIAEDLREDIQLYTRRLRTCGVSMRQLLDAVPKHEDARQRALAAARIVVKQGLLGYSARWHSWVLNLNELQRRAAVSRKTLERQRPYIVGAALLDEFPALRSSAGL